MNDTQKKFIELAKQFEALKEQLKTVGEQLDRTMYELGTGTYLQDEVNGAVYKVVVPEGTFVSFRMIGYERTAFEGEKRGTLSKKEAEEQGFILRK